MIRPEALSDRTIDATIGPTSIRWPSTEVSKTNTFDRCREAVTAMRNLLRAVNANCLAAEKDEDLNPAGIMRHRHKVGRAALAELAELQALRTAETAIEANLQLLERKMDRLPSAPTELADLLMAQEIRTYLRSRPDAFDVVFKSTDPRILGAVLHTLPALSGLTDSQLKMIHERARRALHSEQVQMQELLQKTSGEIRVAVDACVRAVKSRCALEDVSPAMAAMNNKSKPSEAKPKPADTPTAKDAPAPAPEAHVEAAASGAAQAT